MDYNNSNQKKNSMYLFSANIKNYIIVQLITKFLTAAVAQ